MPPPAPRIATFLFWSAAEDMERCNGGTAWRKAGRICFRNAMLQYQVHNTSGDGDGDGEKFDARMDSNFQHSGSAHAHMQEVPTYAAGTIPKGKYVPWSELAYLY